MINVTQDNVREVTESIGIAPEFELHLLYAIRFMAANVHAPLALGEPFTTAGKDGIPSGLYQKLTGDRSYYLGFVDLWEGLKTIAKGFAGDEYEDDEKFIRDATGEFINRINGEFVIASSKSDVNLEMEPQLFLQIEEVASVIKPEEIIHIPVYIGDSKAEMLFVK